MRPVFISLCLLLLVSACQPLSVSTQSDPYANFSQYRSFDWLPEKESASAAKGLLEQQFKFVVERELKGQGLFREPRTPDFLIGFYATQEQRSSERTIENTSYWGGQGRYWLYDDPLYQGRKPRWPYPSSVRSSETLTIDYKEGSMVIDFVDAKTKELIWQAKIEGVIDEQDPVGQLDKAVTKALQQFPPQP